MCRFWAAHPSEQQLLRWLAEGRRLKVIDPRTTEQKQAEGAMGPADFFHWVRATGGKQLPGGLEAPRLQR